MCCSKGVSLIGQADADGRKIWTDFIETSCPDENSGGTCNNRLERVFSNVDITWVSEPCLSVLLESERVMSGELWQSALILYQRIKDEPTIDFFLKLDLCILYTRTFFFQNLESPICCKCCNSTDIDKCQYKTLRLLETNCERSALIILIIHQYH